MTRPHSQCTDPVTPRRRPRPRGGWSVGVGPWAVLLLLPALAVVPLAPALTAASRPAGRLWARWQRACQEPQWAWPVGGPSAYVLRHDRYGSGAFGSPRSGGRTHHGIDLAAPVGTPVRAAQSGIACVGRVHNGMGTYLEIHHAHGYVTLYGHLSERVVADGRWVSRGQVIGLVGKSGNARARPIRPHLHFELRLQGIPLDPMDGYLDGTEPLV